MSWRSRQPWASWSAPFAGAPRAASRGPDTLTNRTDIEFESNGATLSGWLYPAAGDAAGNTDRNPGIVMAHGLTAVKEMVLDRYAEVFSAAGFSTLVYDHFGFGSSDGEPRQSPAPSIQLAGYRDAMAWLAARPEVDADRIGIWGSSFSGGEVIVLSAEDGLAACGVAQVPGFGSDGTHLTEATLAAIMAALESGDPTATVPAVTNTDDLLGIMHTDGAYEWFTEGAASHAPTWRNEVLLSGLTEGFVASENLTSVRIPLRLIVAPDDQITPPQAGMAIAKDVDLIDIVEIPGGHFSAYGEEFDASSGLAVEWFRQHLMG